MLTAFLCQIMLLVYHQATTCLDLYPFNGARNYRRGERFAEAGANLILMGLAPLGFALDIRALQLYGAVYYCVLFLVELVIWWVPYFFVPGGNWRRVYNIALAVGTSNFEPGDTLGHWLGIHQRLHADTVTILPRREGRIVPNLEHIVLHGWTLITAVVTLVAVTA